MIENFFSPIAKDYARFRPRYPEGLFSYLASVAPGSSLAWDCATGSGQAAQDLVVHFERVIATDISDELLGQAPRHEGITYRNANALDSGLADHSIDVVTVANAMHWFHGEAFEREVRRVLRPGGIIAAWSFAYAEISPAIDRLTRRVHDEIVDPFWIEPNRIVENGYRDLHFPFEPVAAPPIRMVSRMDLAAFEGYMRTWSASVKYQKQHGVDPISLVHEELREAWCPTDHVKEVNWRLNVRIGGV